MIPICGLFTVPKTASGHWTSNCRFRFPQFPQRQQATADSSHICGNAPRYLCGEMQTIKKAVPKYDLFHSGGEEGIQDPSTTRGVVISIAAAMEKGSNQPPISGTKKAATSATLFVMAERKGFEPLWLAPNGFQDRLVMTASIPLRSDCITLYFSTGKARCQANSFCRQKCAACCEKVDICAFIE